MPAISSTFLATRMLIALITAARLRQLAENRHEFPWEKSHEYLRMLYSVVFDFYPFLLSIFLWKVSARRQLFMREHGVKNRFYTIAISRSIYI